jgi:hypothetical protein
MSKIKVSMLNGNTFLVEVAGHTNTKHEVIVRTEYAASLLKPNESIASLLERSFAFLLEREPNTSILRQFDLSIISRYFPEYEHKIRT